MNFVLGGLFYDENVEGAAGEAHVKAEFGYEVGPLKTVRT